MRRKSRAETSTISPTQKACHAIARRCGQSCGSSAARATITSGEESGNSAPAIHNVELGEPTAKAAKPKMSTWATVTGIESVWTSRTVEACAPMLRNTEPSSR